MSKLIILSNRVTIPNGQKTTAGGLAVAIQDALDDIGGIWLGWNGERVHKQEEVHFNIFRKDKSRLCHLPFNKFSIFRLLCRVCQQFTLACHALSFRPD